MTGVIAEALRGWCASYARLKQQWSGAGGCFVVLVADGVEEGSQSVELAGGAELGAGIAAEAVRVGAGMMHEAAAADAVRVVVADVDFAERVVWWDGAS